MRNTLPAMTYVQTAFVSLAGHVGVGIEGSNATVGGDDKYHANSGNTLVLPPLSQYGAVTRYFDVFARGTNSCTWTATPLQPWVKLSQYTGSVGPNGSDTRVLVSVDWTRAQTQTVNINVTTPCRTLDRYGFKEPFLQLPVDARPVPSSFTRGWVESDGHVAIEGPHYQRIVAPASPDAAAGNVTYHTFANYGRTSGGVGLWPQNTEKLTVASAPALEYSLYLFSNSSVLGPANITVYLSPSHNYLGDQTPLEYGIALYPADGPAPAPTMVRPVGPFKGQDLPPGWGFAVADSVWGRTGNYTTSRHNVGQPGAYTLRIWALLPSVIVQKIVVDLGGVRPSYLGPPESFLVGRDEKGSHNQTSFLNGAGTLGGLGKAKALG